MKFNICILVALIDSIYSIIKKDNSITGEYFELNHIGKIIYV